MLAAPPVDTRNLFSPCAQRPCLTSSLKPTQGSASINTKLSPMAFFTPLSFPLSPEEAQRHQQSIQSLASELQAQQRQLQQITGASNPLSPMLPLGMLLSTLQSCYPTPHRSDQSDVLPQTPISPPLSPTLASAALPPSPPASPAASPPTTNCVKLSKSMKRYRTRRKFLPQQLKVLEEAYKKDPFPNSFFRSLLSNKLDLPARAIQIWYQNRRVKDRKVFKASPTRSGSLKNEEELLSLVSSLQDKDDMNEEDSDSDESNAEEVGSPSLSATKPRIGAHSQLSMETKDAHSISSPSNSLNHSPKSPFTPKIPLASSIPALSLDREERETKMRRVDPLIQESLWEGLVQGAKHMRARDEVLKACMQGNVVEVQRLLLEDFFLVETNDEQGNTPLLLAAASGHTDIVSTLLFRGADVSRVNLAGFNALMIALNNNHLACAEKILHLCGEKELHQKDKENGNDALLIALKKGSLQIVPRLLEKGSKFEVTDNQGRTPLHIAADVGSNTLASFLLQMDASIHKKDTNGNTPLMIAAIKNNNSIVDLLLEKGYASVEEREKMRKWLSEFVSEKKAEDLVCELLANKLK